MDADLMNAKQLWQWDGSDEFNRFQILLAAPVRVTPTGRNPGVVTQRRLRVLIVDDDRDGADMTAALVSLWGHNALCAHDGVAGLAMALAATPDVVLLDIAMPGMDGCHMAVQLRRCAGLKESFLIAVTGFGNEKLRQRCLEAGIDLFLVKPVEAEVMETLLMLEGQRLGLSPEAPIVLGAKSKTIRAPRKSVLV